MTGDVSVRGLGAVERRPEQESGVNVYVIDVLRTAADSLAVDLAVWAARDPADPSAEARRAHRSAIATADAVANSMARLRASLETPGGTL